jgi:dCMP deaminase
MNWHEYFIKMAETVRLKSKDRSTQVGAVIVGPDHEVLAIGFNGFPRGVDDNIDSRHERPAKYAYTEHAERNAIYNAARHGISLKDAWLYLDSCPYPCADCARGVIQSGIAVVVGRDIPFSGKGPWLESQRMGREMILEAGVKILVLDNNFNPKAFEGNWGQNSLYWLTADPKFKEERMAEIRQDNLKIQGKVDCLGL